MKALSVRQPWASLIVTGPKRVENRTWATKYRGPLLIHAGVSRADIPSLDDFPLLSSDRLPFGAFVGAVVLSECLPVGRAPAGPFTEGPWCWLVGEPIAFRDPVPWKGRLGLFDVSDDLAWQWIGAAGSGASRHLSPGREACCFAPRPQECGPASIPTSAD